jgi:hypothetical protein
LHGDGYVKSIQSSLFGELNEKQKMYGKPLSWYELKNNFQRETFNISRQELRCILRNTFRSHAACFKAGGQHFKTLLRNRWSCAANADTKFLGNAGFIHDKAPVTAYVVWGTILNMSCSNSVNQKYSKHDSL